MNKIICKVETGKRLELHKFEDFQGELKRLPPRMLEKLKNNILSNGFCAPVYIWKGTNKILDGHGRLFALNSLFKDDDVDWYIKDPNGSLIKSAIEIPIVEIDADNEQKAAELVLSYNSEFGKINKKGLNNFLEIHNLDLDLISERINLSVNPIELSVPDPLPIESNIKSNEVKGVDKLGSHVITCPQCKFEFKRK